MRSYSKILGLRLETGGLGLEEVKVYLLCFYLELYWMQTHSLKCFTVSILKLEWKILIKISNENFAKALTLFHAGVGIYAHPMISRKKRFLPNSSCKPIELPKMELHTKKQVSVSKNKKMAAVLKSQSVI